MIPPPTRTRKSALAPPPRRGRPAAPRAGPASSASVFLPVSVGLLITLSSPARDMLSGITYGSPRTFSCLRLSRGRGCLALIAPWRGLRGRYLKADGFGLGKGERERFAYSGGQ